MPLTSYTYPPILTEYNKAFMQNKVRDMVLYECEIVFPKDCLYTFIPVRVPNVGLVYPLEVGLSWRWGIEINEAKKWGAMVTIKR